MPDPDPVPPPWPRRVRAGLAGALGIGLCALHAAAQPAPGQIDLRIAHERSVGRFGEHTRTTIDQTTLSARYHGTAWSVDVQLPWLRVHSPDGAGLPDAPGGTATRAEGPGDVWLRGRLGLRPSDAEGPGLDLVVRLKLATGAAERGLGSGGRDVALQLDLDHVMSGVQWMAHLGWRRTGDPAGLAPYRNPWYGGAGMQVEVAPAWEAGAGVDWRQPIGRLGPLQEATFHLAWRAGAQRWQWHLTRGWARASPDLAMGLSWRQRF